MIMNKLLFGLFIMLGIVVSNFSYAASDNVTQSSAPCKTLAAQPTYLDGELHIPTCDLKGNLVTNGTGGTSPSPYVLTYLGKQSISAATIATSTALTPPTGATMANFFPECATNGTDGQCVRFNPNGVADASASAGIGSQQLYLGETSATLSNYQVILAVGATGAAGTISTLTVYYYK